MSLSFGAGIALCAAVVGTNPRVMFERVSGDSGTTDTRTRLARDQKSKSLLDSVLDHAMILYGSGMSNSNLHLPKNLPLALVEKMGLRMDHFGDSTGAFNRLSDV